MQFKNVTEKIATYWLLQNKGRTKRPSLQVPPRVPIFTTHSPPATPGLMATTPMSPKDFTRQLSSRLTQLQQVNLPTKLHNNPSIVVDSPGHHDEDEGNLKHHEHEQHNHVVPRMSGGSRILRCCMPSINNRVGQDPIEPVEIFARKDSFESDRKDSHDSGILVNPITVLQEVPEDEPARHRRPGVCESHQLPNVSEICQQYEKIADEHKTKQERLVRRSSEQERLARKSSSEGPQQLSPIHKSSSVSM